MFWRRKKKEIAKHRPPRRLGVEQLESRCLNSVGGLQSSFPLPSAPVVLGPAQLSSSSASPNIVSRILVDGGTIARGTSAAISVKGSDDGGEAFITYRWSITQIPIGAQVSFASNNTNASKNTRMTFSRAGDYTIRVTLTDQDGRSTASSLTFTVAQTLTNFQIRTPDGQLINSNTPIQVSRTNHRIIVEGLDQFGNAIAKLPTIAWRTKSAPLGAGLTTVMKDNIATQAFTRVGLYQIRASSGTALIDYSVQVVATPTSLSVVTATGGAIVNGSRMSATTSSQRFSLIGRDQFGQRLVNQSATNWSILTRPVTAAANFVTSGVDATLSVDRAGVYAVKATHGNLTFTVSVNFVPTLNFLRFLTDTGAVIGANDVQSTNGSSLRFPLRGYDQFNNPMQNLPGFNWLAITSPLGGRVTGAFDAGQATISFSLAGSYLVRVSAGNVTALLSANVNQTLTSIAVTNSLNQSVRHGTASSTSGLSESLVASGRDQFGSVMQSQPQFHWTLLSIPKDSVTAIAAPSSSTASMNFDRAGVYSLRLSVPSLRVFETRIEVNQVLSGLAFVPDSIVINAGTARQMVVEGRDQFSQSMTVASPITWSATGGTVVNSGLFTAGNTAGAFAVTARTGNWAANLAVQVISGNPGAIFTDPNFANAVSVAYADNSISRLEMISLLRGVGIDGTVGNAELTDLRTLVTSTSYVMPSHVRALAKKVVFYHLANENYQGQVAGNLVDGSSAVLLNNLIDKWFLGSDVPAITGIGQTYQTALGALFEGNPNSLQVVPGIAGHSYFLNSLGSIADRNANAIRNMLLDNGDGTFTVRFYAGSLGSFVLNNGRLSNGFSAGTGTADYVTVDRQLPALADGTLVYAGAGQNVATASAIWAALAEKAYAQWHETGNAGRNGVNSYAALTGGWMSTSNAHILGYNSTNFAFSNAIAETLIEALSLRKAVTMSTRSGASGGGLTGSQTYAIAGYNAAQKTFSLKTISGSLHPVTLTWAQLQANGLHFCVVGPIVSSSFNGPAS
jgi:hypothetical protein